MNEQWRSQRERGSRSLVRLIIWLALHSGRALCRVLLVPICIYFLLTAPLARRSSLAFLSRALHRRATWRDSFMHLFVFATTLLDRVYLVNGRQREFKVEVNNEPAFWQALMQGRGCLLLGSHLGSFEMLGVIGGAEKKLVINVVMHLSDSEGLRDLISSHGHELPYKIIPLGHPDSMLRVKECLARGEVVGILADRVYGDERTQSLPFLGCPARFSLSPLRLAKIIGAPVLMVYGLFRGGRRYEIAFEPMTELTLQCYVETLERKARRFPYNWFNFYDYWSVE
ncbi:acyl-CoA synthetase [Georgfuchsia toluolica]|nr:acyl-CoA synthetase [Georgfuchsia toluolica]